MERDCSLERQRNNALRERPAAGASCSDCSGSEMRGDSKSRSHGERWRSSSYERARLRAWRLTAEAASGGRRMTKPRPARAATPEGQRHERCGGGNDECRHRAAAAETSARPLAAHCTAPTAGASSSHCSGHACATASALLERRCGSGSSGKDGASHTSLRERLQGKRSQQWRAPRAAAAQSMRSANVQALPSQGRALPAMRRRATRRACCLACADRWVRA